MKSAISLFLCCASAITLSVRPAAAQTAQASAATVEALPDRAAIHATLERSALAEINRIRTQEATQIPTAPGRPHFFTSWVPATFYVGAARLARVSENPEIYQFLLSRGQRFQYALRGPGTPAALLNADDQAIGDLYQEIYARRGLPGTLMPLKQRLDFTAPYLSKTPVPKRLLWWWSDSLFMAPPVFARMSALTGDPNYLRAMDVQWWRTYDRLWDKSERLFYRDERFLTRRSGTGRKIFWSRGNGWVIAGLARVLESMPANFPSRPRYEQLFREMSARLIRLQHADGLWRTSLLDPQSFPEPETSGSAFFTYALSFGVNHGLLDRATYQPHALRGWQALNRYVLHSGLLGQVQRAGDQPVPTRREDTALYASGAFLLAGLEVANLGRAATALPLPEPARDADIVVEHDIGPNRPATTPEQEAENRRRDAERQSMIDLAYDPATDDPDYRSPVVARVVGSSASTVPLRAPTAGERIPRAAVRFAPDRFDDILWENDRAAFRLYGPTLEKREPPSGSGIDAWAKGVRWPFMDRQLKTVTYHNDQGEGMDYYNVRQTRGVGGLGIWHDNKLWVSRNFKTYQILRNGPDTASFRVDYAPWPVDVGRKVWETRTITLPMGTNLNRMVSTIHSDSPAPLIAGIGLGKNATVQARGTLFTDRARGIISYWEPTDPDHGSMGTAIIVDPASIVDFVSDADNNLVLVRVTPGKPFTYYAGSAWDRGLDFKSRQEWEAYLKSQRLKFAP